MTNALTAVRNQVMDVLTSLGIAAHAYIPETINPPMAVVRAGQPYLEDGDDRTFTGLQVRLVIEIVLPLGNDAQEALDQAVTDFCNAVPGQWNLENVLQPVIGSTNGQEVIAVEITVTTSVELEKEVM